MKWAVGQCRQSWHFDQIVLTFISCESVSPLKKCTAVICKNFPPSDLHLSVVSFISVNSVLLFGFHREADIKKKRIERVFAKSMLFRGKN